MEKRDYNCPECGTVMNETYEKPQLILTCPKCGCKIATTRWDEIDLDDNEYEITLVANDNPSIEQIKAVSKIAATNYKSSKEIIVNGKSIFRGNPIQVKDISQILKEKMLDYKISPDFPY